MSRTGAFVISGASSGIGLALARKLANEGHRVYGLARDRAKLARAAAEIRGFAYTSVDLSEAKASHAAVGAIRQWLEAENLQLLGLVNNAGVVDRIAFHLTSDAIWERQFHNNLLSAVRLTRELYPDLHRARPASVLNVSSNLGIKPISHTSAYSSIKAAMIAWTKALALEWAAEGVRVNCLCPGLVDTPIHAFHGHGNDDPRRVQGHAVQPMGRMGLAEEIAESAAFLLSERSAWTTGSVFVVDGGGSL